MVELDWNNVVTMLTAAFSAFAALMVYLTNQRVKEQGVKLEAQGTKLDAQGGKIDAQGQNIQKIELATNSMKDALVASTDRAGLAEGEAIGRQKQRSERLAAEEALALAAAKAIPAPVLPAAPAAPVSVEIAKSVPLEIKK